MSKLVNFNFNELSRMNNDSAVTTQEHIMNTNAANYRLYNPYENKCMGGLDFATKQPNVFVNKSTEQLGPLGCNVSDNSLLKKSVLTNPNDKITLHDRPYNSVPYLGRGNVDVYEENKLRLGDTFKEKKSVTKINEQSFFDVKQFPMQDNIKQHYNNSKIESDTNSQWVRGGMDTRILFQNVDYSKK
jgi:hypothetical protein